MLAANPGGLVMSDHRSVTPAELDGRIRALARKRCKMLAVIATLLLAMKRGGWYRRLGFASIAGYAFDAASFSKRKTVELIELAERAEKLPKIAAAFAAGDVQWTKLRTIARVATASTEAEWLAKAASMTSRRLERETAEAEGKDAPPVRVVFEFTAEQAADFEDMVRKLRRQRDTAFSREEAALLLMKRGLSPGKQSPPFQTVVYRCEECGAASRESRDGPVEVSEATAGRAACDSTIVDGSKPAKIAHTIPPATRRFVLARDRGRCVVPGCSNRDFVEVHHRTPLAHGGNHDPAGLVTLCDAHHGIVHAGLLRIEGRAPRLRFVRLYGVELRRAS
jgi:hypothetical protein